MRSITTWTRLEPRTRNESMTDGLQARVHDPLWFLGRQWQVGEFEGEDTGSLVRSELGVAHDHLARYRPGGPEDGAASQPYGEAGTAVESEDRQVGPPLETLVEREAVRPPPGTDGEGDGRDGEDGGDGEGEGNEGDGEKTERESDLRLAAEAGLHFLHLLGGRGLSFDSEDFPEFRLSADRDDEVSRQFSQVVGGRVLDGDALYGAVADAEPADFPRPDGLADDDVGTYEEAVEAYREWHETLYAEPACDEATAWTPERLEYRFAVSTGAGDEETVFEADEYSGTGLDWYSFDATDDRSLAPDEDEDENEPTVERSREVVPTRVTFRGMPDPRWWQLEDSDLDLSRLEAGGEDLSRVLFREFTLLYGNDWFVLPVTVPVGSLTRITGLSVTNTFGETFEVGPVDTSGGDWNVFASGDGRPGLFVPPVLAESLETEPVEEVRFARDEIANVGWAIERQIEGPTGDALDRHEAERRPFPKPDRDSEATGPAESGEAPVEAYRLMSDVPDYWYPLLPRRERLGHVLLKRGELLRPDENDEADAGPYGRILAVEDLSLPEEEVPRSGVTVSRNYRYARWLDGTAHLWSGRTTRFGRGETSSGLEFDYLEPQS